jgi:hypothetical protein
LFLSQLHISEEILDERVEDQLIALTIFENADDSSARREQRLAIDLQDNLNCIEENLGTYNSLLLFFVILLKINNYSRQIEE